MSNDRLYTLEELLNYNRYTNKPDTHTVYTKGEIGFGCSGISTKVTLEELKDFLNGFKDGEIIFIDCWFCYPFEEMKAYTENLYSIVKNKYGDKNKLLFKHLPLNLFYDDNKILKNVAILQYLEDDEEETTNCFDD